MEQDVKTQLLAAAAARHMGRDNAAEDLKEVAGDVDDIPVQIRFDVGCANISLRELRRLGRGAVLSLGRSLDDLVEIRVNGCLIGRGTLVDVTGTVGVRIVSLIDYD